MSEHTPGPWYMAGELICAHTARGQVEIATVHGESEYVARLPQQANARLIAAAPDLLEALKDMGRVSGLAEPAVRRASWERAMAVIAKAEGR